MSFFVEARRIVPIPLFPPLLLVQIPSSSSSSSLLLCISNSKTSKTLAMHITDEQRKRAEANRLAALAKRKAILESFNGGQQLQQQEQPPWTLFKCPKLSHELAPNPNSLAHSSSTIQKDPIRVADLPEKFRVRLEICSPDSFSASPIALRGFAFPGGDECLRRLTDCLSNVSDYHFFFLNSGVFFT